MQFRRTVTCFLTTNKHTIVYLKTILNKSCLMHSTLFSIKMNSRQNESFLMLYVCICLLSLSACVCPYVFDVAGLNIEQQQTILGVAIICNSAWMQANEIVKWKWRERNKKIAQMIRVKGNTVKVKVKRPNMLWTSWFCFLLFSFKCHLLRFIASKCWMFARWNERATESVSKIFC